MLARIITSILTLFHATKQFVLLGFVDIDNSTADKMIGVFRRTKSSPGTQEKSQRDLEKKYVIENSK